MNRIFTSRTGMKNLLAEYDKATQDIMQLQMKLSEMQNTANSELEVQRAELRATMMNKSVEINSLKSSIRLAENEISNSHKKITELTEEKARLWNTWKTIKAEKFDSIQLSALPVTESCRKKMLRISWKPLKSQKN